MDSRQYRHTGIIELASTTWNPLVDATTSGDELDGDGSGGSGGKGGDWVRRDRTL